MIGGAENPRLPKARALVQHRAPTPDFTIDYGSRYRSGQHLTMIAGLPRDRGTSEAYLARSATDQGTCRTSACHRVQPSCCRWTRFASCVDKAKLAPASHLIDGEPGRGR